MASARVSANLPFYDTSKSSLAYGDRAIPKLVSNTLRLEIFQALSLSLQNRELQSSDVRVRQQALLLLNDVIHRRENLAAALREGIGISVYHLWDDVISSDISNNYL